MLPGVDRMPAGRKPGGEPGVGALRFRLRPAKMSVLIFPKGPPHKIQVAWTNDKEKEVYFPKLKSLLVPIEGQKEVILTPLYMNILKLPYPGPLNFTLAWCKEKVKFSRVVSGFFDWWERRAERKRHEKQYEHKRIDDALKELRCELAICHEEMQLDEDDSEHLKKVSEIEYKWRKKYGLA